MDLEQPPIHEEILFENKFIPTNETWDKTARRTYRASKNMFHIAALLCLLLAIAEGAAILILGNRNFTILIFLFVFLAITLYVLPIIQIRRIKSTLISHEGLLNSGREEPISRGVRFYEDDFENLIHGSRFLYSQVSKVHYDKSYIYIIVEAQMLFLVKRDTFTIGTDEAFISFIEQKTTSPRSQINKKLVSWAALLALAFVIATYGIFISFSYSSALWQLLARRGGGANIATTSERGISITAAGDYVYFQVPSFFEGTRIMRYSSYSDAYFVAEVPEEGVMGFIGDTLYLVTPSLGTFAIDPQSGEVSKISTVSGTYAVFTSDWIYIQNNYYNYPGWYAMISRIRPDGSEFTVLSERQGTGLQLYEGYLYFYCLGDEAVIKMGLDGNCYEIVMANTGMYYMHIHDGWIYYINPSHQLYRANMESGRHTSLNALVAAFAITHDSIVTLDLPAEGEIADNMSAMLLHGGWHRQYIQFGGVPIAVSGDIYFFQQVSGVLFRAHIYDRGIVPIY